MKPTTLIAVGGSATEGDGVADRFRVAWPYLLFNEAFPISTTFVNAAIDGATVANASVTQLPLAQTVKPDVVAIFLGIDDLEQHTAVDSFASGLRTLIEGLQAAGADRILIADLPSALGADAASYDDAIRRVVKSTKTTLVELQDAAITLTAPRHQRDLPDAASHRVIATAFEHAFKGGA